MPNNDIKIVINKESVKYKNKLIIFNDKLKPLNKPVNKSIKKIAMKKAFKEKKNNLSVKSESVISSGVTIITCTNKTQYLDNIFKNYERQDYEKKELIIILNKNNIDVNIWRKRAEQSNNVRVFHIDEKITLGQCLNFGVKQAKYEIIAKFDDDDYYAPRYITDSIRAFEYTDADLIGKGSTYVYLESIKTLAIRDPQSENRYVRFVNGSTMIFKKKIFNKVRFANVSVGEDVIFCRDCYTKGIKIYSTSKSNHVYIRHTSKNNHIWKINDKNFLKYCKVIGKVDDYIAYATM